MKDTRKRRYRRCIPGLTIALLLVGVPVAAWAQAPATPAPAAVEPGAAESVVTAEGGVPANATGLQATVLVVNGRVEARRPGETEWQPVARGAKLPIGAGLRTGFRSAVRFTIPPTQIVDFDRMGEMKILTAELGPDGEVKTDLGMTHGRIKYQIEAGGVEHAVTIRSPSAVLAVRGSTGTLNDDALGAWAFGDGKLTFFDVINRRWMEFGRDTVADVSPEADSAAALAQKRTIDADPKGAFGGRDDIEKAILAQYLAGGGIDSNSFNFVKRLVGEENFAASLQITGSLLFVLNWASGFPSTNLDLRVKSPMGDTITSANLPGNPTFTGGLFDANGDQTAGFFPPAVPNATESAGWLVAPPRGSFPPGKHVATVILQDGAQPPFATLTVVRDFVPGQPNFLLLNQQIDVDGVQKQGATVEVNVNGAGGVIGGGPD